MAKSRKGMMYVIIHNRLRNSVNGSKIICRKDLFTMFGKVYHIPKPKRYFIMRELSDLKMVKIGKDGMITILG